MPTDNSHHRPPPAVAGSGAAEPEPTALRLTDFFRAVANGKWLILATIVLSVALATVWLTLQPIQFTAQMVVATARSDGEPSLPRPQIPGQIGSALGISLPSGATATLFDQYIELLTSARLAKTLSNNDRLMRTLFANQWDHRSHEWQPPQGMIATAKRSIYRLFDIPNWSPPSAFDLSQYLKENLQIQVMTSPGMRRISIDAHSPDFGIQLLRRLHQRADEIIRREEKHRTRKQISYIEHKLGETRIAEYQDVLTKLLSSQEQNMMLLDVDLPYAAKLIEPPVASDIPVSPKPLKTILLAITIGAIFGLTGAFFRAAWIWQHL